MPDESHHPSGSTCSRWNIISVAYGTPVSCSSRSNLSYWPVCWMHACRLSFRHAVEYICIYIYICVCVCVWAYVEHMHNVLLKYTLHVDGSALAWCWSMHLHCSWYVQCMKLLPFPSWGHQDSDPTQLNSTERQVQFSCVGRHAMPADQKCSTCSR